MKIGIFGDSFAADNRKKSWVSMISNNNDIYRYAHGGTSLFHCYYTMLKHDLSTYDKIMASITNSGRIYSGYEIDIKKPFLSGLDTALYHKSRVHHDDIGRIDAGIGYYVYLSTEEFNLYVQEKLVNDIIQMCGNKLIILPAFEHSYCPSLETYVSSYIDNKFSLYQVTQMEKKVLGIPDNAIETYNIYNHMSEENNKILYELVSDLLLEKNVCININAFKTPKMNGKFYYEF